MTVETFNVSGTWKCPAGVTLITRLQLWGAGADGENNGALPGQGGGGGGYGESAGIAVTPDNFYTLNIPTDSSDYVYFDNGTVTFALAGSGVNGGNDNGGNVTSHNGGQGGATGATSGGGGGGSAGSAADGNSGGDGSGATGGTGATAVTEGAAGGNGGNLAGNGANGATPGGGGGGNGAGGTAGTGGLGQIRLTYTAASAGGGLPHDLPHQPQHQSIMAM